MGGAFPVYSRALSDPVPDGVHLTWNHQVVLVEGNYLLLWDDTRWAPLRDVFDECWLLKSLSEEMQRERLIERHLRSWSREKAELWGAGRFGAAAKVEANDIPNLKIVEGTSGNADRIISISE